MATVRQLARLAGVCPATVSRALRDDPRISLATRERVQELDAAFRRHPEQRFQALLAGRNGAIGCLLPYEGLPNDARVLQGILEAAFSAAYHVTVIHARTTWQEVLLGYQALAEAPVDGIIMSHGWVENRMPLDMLLNFRSRGITLIGVGGMDVGMPIDTVQSDETAISALMVDYLWDLGHRIIAYCGYVDDVRGGYVLAALRRQGALASEYLATRGGSMNNALTALLTAPTPPTAIIAFSDLVAAELLQQAWRREVRVPEDLSILGCSNILPLPHYTTPPLTTIEEDPEEKGRQTVALLLERLREDAPAANRAPATRLITPHLVIRESCAPPPSESPKVLF